MSCVELRHLNYIYPPNQVLSLTDKCLSVGPVRVDVTFTRVCVSIVLLLTIVELSVFGVPESPSPYSYEFYLMVLLSVLILVYLKKFHKHLVKSADEFIDIAKENKEDPLVETVGTSEADLAPDQVKKDLENLLYRGFHPITMLGGGLAVFALSVVLVWIFGSEISQPTVARFSSFVNGMIVVPIAYFFIYSKNIRKYIIDVRFFDPDGVGGLHRTGSAVVSVATYLIVHITLLSAIVSALYFAGQTGFLLTVSAILVGWVALVLGGTALLTVLIRRKLVDVRKRKAMQMEKKFKKIEHRFWSEETEPDLEDSMAILAMQSQYREMSRMNMWPINLVNLAKLIGSVAISLASVIVYMNQLGIM